MRKLFFIAVTCVAIFGFASFFSCTAQTPKANLKTGTDSLAYAYGVSASKGFSEYLDEQGYNSAAKAKVIEGILEGAKINKNDTLKLAYSQGLQIGQNLVVQYLTQTNAQVYNGDESKSLNKDLLIAGFISSVSGKDPIIPLQDAQIYVEDQSQKIRAAAGEKDKEKNLAFLAENKKKEGVVTLESGLQYKVIKEGNGPKPTAEDVVKVKYIGTGIDGKKFDASADHSPDGTSEFPLGQVITGWIEGIQLMSVGSKYNFYIPYDLAYGEEGGPVGAYGTLIFEVELIDIVKSETPN
ncbi:MAG: FKBP-type peptidyl-prolyl cis-trans isomerase [Candidatus Symbiothrix sp.]|jgi:FKBP-type peptidyl-prolyl cis-trans isomerase FklB|nr:FKBP-type peptidyl-prolyl cis-trans isomerase [Candidatus Symbiothrix sp.]